MPPDDGGTTLEDFLAGSSGGSDNGEQIERLGHLLSLFGVTLALGVVIALAGALRAARADHRSLLRIVLVGGLLVLAGGVVEVVGLAAIGDQAWSEAFDGEFAAASMMRIIAGLMIAFGFIEASDGSWRPDSGSAFGMAGAALAVMSFGFDGHTVTEGLRAVHMILNAAHVTAGAAWFGGVVALVVVAFLRRRRGDQNPIGELVVRFSATASISLIVATLAGVLMTLMIIDEQGDVTSTEWGRTLLVKMAAVGVTVAVGAYNHFVVVPRLARDPANPGATRTVRSTLTIEAVVLSVVVVATAFLVDASTN